MTGICISRKKKKDFEKKKKFNCTKMSPVIQFYTEIRFKRNLDVLYIHCPR